MSNERKLFRMSDEDHAKIIAIARDPSPVMYLSGGREMFSSKQARANDVWKEMAIRLGFVWDTAESAGTGDAKEFTAICNDTPEQAAEPERQNKAAARRVRIETLKAELQDRETELAELEATAD